MTRGVPLWKKAARWFTLDVIRPAMAPLVWVISSVYVLLFARREAEAVKRDDKRLGDEVRAGLTFLFADYGATVGPDEELRARFPRGFAPAVIVAFGGLRLRLISDRGELRAQVARSGAAPEWSELYWVLGLVDPRNWSVPKPFRSIPEVGLALRPNVDKILGAFASDQYSETQEHLRLMRARERVVADQLASDINRRWYG